MRGVTEVAIDGKLSETRRADIKLIRAVPYIRVADMERSVAFYRDALGFEMRASTEERERLFWARIENGPAALMLSLGAVRFLDHEEDEDHEHTYDPSSWQRTDVGNALFFYVDDADAVHARIRAAGYQPTEAPADKPYGLREFLLQDPDGYWLVIAQTLPPRPGPSPG